MRFTDQTVRALPHPESGQRDYADDTLSGFALRVGKRTKTFMVTTGKGTTRIRHTVGRYDPPYLTLAMAREKARDIIAQERFKQTEASRTKFADALEVYYRVHLSKLRPASSRNVQQSLDRRFRPVFGTRALADIKRSEIAPVLDTMLDVPGAMHSTFKYLRSFFNWCVQRGYIETAPTDRMEAPKRGESRTRVLSPEELVAVWRAAPDSDYGRILKLCILSGQRRSQWGASRREYIQTETVTWPAELMKGGREHTIPLTPMMKALVPNRIGYLFPNENNVPFANWTRNKDRLTDDCGVQAFRLHDLRRTWATISAEYLDVQPHIIEAVLAHRTGSEVSRTYNRARYIEPMRKAMIAFEEWLQTLLSNTETANGHGLQRLHQNPASSFHEPTQGDGRSAA